MSTEVNKAVIRRLFEEVFNRGDVEVIDEIVAEEVIGHDATSEEPKRGRASVKQVAILFRTAFPGAQYPLADVIAEDDKVVARWGLQGIHQAEFMDVAPTQRAVKVTGIVIYRLAEQKIVEYWGNFDTLGLMRQLGALP
jgi:predicted ester cyclase